MKSSPTKTVVLLFSSIFIVNAEVKLPSNTPKDFISFEIHGLGPDDKRIEALRVDSNGDFFIRGKKTTNDMTLYNALKNWAQHDCNLRCCK